MAANTKNKYPADKTGTKYSEFRNTKRVAPGKVKSEREKQQATTNTAQAEARTS